MTLFMQAVVSGLTFGSIYGLVGLGYVIVYKATKVLNFALGDLVMLGAMIGLILHVEQQIPYWPTFIAVLIIVAVIGLVIERVAYRPLLKAPHFAIILTTAAIGEIIRSMARIWRGDELRYFPAILSRKPLDIGGIAVSPLGMAIIGIGLALVLIFYLFFNFTTTGKTMRAASQNLDAASLVGIDVPRTFALLWAIASAMAAAAGMLIAPLVLITPEMGNIAIKAFVAAILGGFTSIPGAIVGGLLWGVTENLVGIYISTAFKDVVAFIVLIAVLMVKPAGLFGKQQRVRV